MAALDEYRGIFRLLNKQQDMPSEKDYIVWKQWSYTFSFHFFNLEGQTMLHDINKTKKMQ